MESAREIFARTEEMEDLKEELEIVKKQLEGYQRREMGMLHIGRQLALQRHRLKYANDNPETEFQRCEHCGNIIVQTISDDDEDYDYIDT